MKTKGLLFDLEEILLFPLDSATKENDFLLDFFLTHQYIHHRDELLDKTPWEFLPTITNWQNNDAAVLENEIRKIRRNALMTATADSEACGVFQALSARYHIVLLSASQGDGIIKALTKANIRSYVDFIVPGEAWVEKAPLDLGIQQALAKFPSLSKENWHYICRRSSLEMAKAAGIPHLIYGEPPCQTLEDVMEAFLL